MALAGRFGGKCASVQAILPTLVDDEVTSRDDVWPHLRACAVCRAEYAAYLRANRALARLAALPEPRAGFFAELERATLRALPQRTGLPQRVGRSPRVERPRRRSVVAAACFLLGLGAAPAWTWLRSGDLGDRLPVAAAPPGTAVPASYRGVQPLSNSSRHQGLRGQQLAEQGPWGDGRMDALPRRSR